MQPAYQYEDGTGFGHPWELIPLGNYTLRTKDGGINGYLSEFQMAVRNILFPTITCISAVHSLSCGQALLLLFCSPPA